MELYECIYDFLNQYVNREFAVFVTAWLPIVELRGAIPLALSLGIEPGKAFFLGVTGNMVPVIPILFLLRPVRDFLIRNSVLMEKFFDWLYERTIRKSDNVERYGALGLILFTAIPFPTTGAWTACLAAVIFNIKFRYAFPAVVIGVLLAGIVVTLASTAII